MKSSSFLMGILFCVLASIFFSLRRDENLDRLAAIISTKAAWADQKTVKFSEEITLGTAALDREDYVFAVIRDIEIDEAGCIYVLDGKNCRIQKFSKEGLYLGTIGKGKGQGPGELQRPMRMALGPTKTLYVGDYDRSAVLIFNRDGDYISSVPIEPYFGDIAVDRRGNFFVTRFSNQGEYGVSAYDVGTGKNIGRFCPNRKDLFLSGETPQLAVDDEGNILCSLYYPYDIYKYSPAGKLLLRFARRANTEPPRKNEMGTLFVPWSSLSLAVFPDGKILNVTRHLSREGQKYKVSFTFDIFSKDGRWLLSAPPDSLKNDWLRIVRIGPDGRLYLDYSEPYPHIKRFAVTIVNR
jgi:hypothetical protein